MPNPLATYKREAERALDLYSRALEELELKNIEGYEDYISPALKELVRAMELGLRTYLLPELSLAQRQEIFDRRANSQVSLTGSENTAETGQVVPSEPACGEKRAQ